MTAPPRSAAGWRLSLAAVWLGLSALFGGLLVVSRGLEGPLDDRDLAYQRPGILDAAGRPYVAPHLPGPFPRPGHRGLAFFVRPAELPTVEGALARDPSLQGLADLTIVVGSSSPQQAVGGVPVVVDPTGSIAAAYGMRPTRDGGPPVGFAVVDSLGLVRYATLDPGVAERFAEVETILDATP